MSEEGVEFPARLSVMFPDASEAKMPGDRIMAIMPSPASHPSSIARRENSDLERRLLALERVLQVLVAHLGEAEPKVLARLTETFCVPQRMTQSEHDYTDTDSYAAEIVRSVVRLGTKTARTRREFARNHRFASDAVTFRLAELPTLLAEPCIQVRQAGGAWRVTKDTRFHGDFLKEEDALQAVEAAAGPGAGLF